MASVLHVLHVKRARITAGNSQGFWRCDRAGAISTFFGLTEQERRPRVSRTSWFDESGQHPAVQEGVNALESFTTAMADGVVEPQELAAQEQRLLAAMRALEPTLNDDLHASVTTVLVELSAYNIMRLLHELRAQQVKAAFGRA
jgi:hypothetical protein